MSKKQNIRVGITVGDLNGIGLEVIMKTFADKRVFDGIDVILYGSAKVFSYHKKALNFNNLIFNTIKNTSEAEAGKINLINCWNDDVNIELGTASEEVGKYAFISLEKAVEEMASGKIDVLLTAPINKKTIQNEKFNFPGHTEFLANYSNEENPLMLMVADNLRVGTLTGHIPLKDVSSKITEKLILSKLEVFNKSLISDFGITKPKIAVLGLNPHAGDDGLLGKEEKEIIIPAIAKANENGIMAFGPYASDGLFGSDNIKNFDGILAMYHDQGLTPFKALAFDYGVNFTAGLPIVRTSPDHGVAYNIAGKNVASEISFREALYVACDVFKNRKAKKELEAGALKK